MSSIASPWSSGRKSKREAFSLLEIVVTISVMSILLLVGTTNISQQIAYIRARTAAERLCNSLQLAQGLARTSRLDPAAPTPGLPPHPRFGVVIYPRRAVVPTEADCHSFLLCRNDDPERRVDFPAPGATQADITNAGLNHELGRLTGDTRLFRNWAPGGPGAGEFLGEARILFTNEGYLDPASRLNGAALPMAAGAAGLPRGNFFTFDIVNESFGYVRIRIRENGSVERSGYNPLDQGPLSRLGAAF